MCVNLMDIDRELANLISEHMTEYVIAYTRFMDNEVSASQYYILQTIAQEGAKTSSELASVLKVSLAAVTNLTNKLESKGYVERVVMPTDRRHIFIHITKPGQSVVDMMQERHLKLCESFQTMFSDEEKMRLTEAYRKMIDAMKQESGPISKQENGKQETKPEMTTM